MDMTTEFLAAIGAILGAASAIVSHLVPWFKDRDNLAKNQKIIESARLEVDFIASWVAAAAEFSGDEIDEKRSQAKKKLVRLLDYPEVASNKDIEDSEKPRAGILVSIAFYAYLGLYSFILLGASIGENDEISLLQLLSEDNLVTLLFLFIPLLILFFARRRSIAQNIQKQEVTA